MRLPSVAIASRRTHGDVCVAEVKANTDAVEVAHFQNHYQVLRSRRLTQQILNKKAHAERAARMRPGAQTPRVLFRSCVVTTVFPLAQMDDNIAKRNIFGGLDRALDLIHRVNAARLLRMQHVDRRARRRGPFRGRDKSVRASRTAPAALSGTIRPTRPHTRDWCSRSVVARQRSLPPAHRRAPRSSSSPGCNR